MAKLSKRDLDRIVTRAVGELMDDGDLATNVLVNPLSDDLAARARTMATYQVRVGLDYVAGLRELLRLTEAAVAEVQAEDAERTPGVGAPVAANELAMPPLFPIGEGAQRREQTPVTQAAPSGEYELAMPALFPNN